jgi:hypothetical protein
VQSDARFIPNAKIATRDRDFLELFHRTLGRIPTGTPPALSVRRVGLKRRGELPGLAGLTRWGDKSLGGNDGGTDTDATKGSQSIAFYTQLLSRLSEAAQVGVFVHELAHAWLNEHVSPESSAAREREADALARNWGFGEELDALDRESDPL